MQHSEPHHIVISATPRVVGHLGKAFEPALQGALLVCIGRYLFPSCVALFFSC
jgi:hypothetical protein